ncbi:MAG: hypothetical protein AB9M53_03290 [Leptothrix sp. (in: b-proteobacteria)]
MSSPSSKPPSRHSPSCSTSDTNSEQATNYLVGTPAFVASRHGREYRVVHETATLIAAPNWSPVGRWML